MNLACLAASLVSPAPTGGQAAAAGLALLGTSAFISCRWQKQGRIRMKGKACESPDTLVWCINKPHRETRSQKTGNSVSLVGGVAKSHVKYLKLSKGGRL